MLNRPITNSDERNVGNKLNFRGREFFVNSAQNLLNESIDLLTDFSSKERSYRHLRLKEHKKLNDFTFLKAQNPMTH